MQIIPVILSGGSGTRLWPLSRKQYPKQYLPLASDNTMLQETILIQILPQGGWWQFYLSSLVILKLK